jgi:SWI/SNF-related matrix-associated actin-dependent regulator 1 of chromatin subfamily A
MAVELKQYQAKGVRTINHYDGRILLADEMGLGKTIQALWWLKEHPEIRPAVIVCPAHLRWHWEDEAKSKCGLRAVVLTGRKTFRLAGMGELKPGAQVNRHLQQVVIVGYDTLEAWLNELLRLRALALIADEIHYIKNRGSHRSKALRKLSAEIPHIVAISGTALVNRPAELWPTLNMLWPKEFPSFFSFALRYCRAVKLPWGWDFSGASRLGELHGRLKELGMLRRLKKDELKDLPPKQRTVVPLDIPMADYNKARDDFVNWVQNKHPDKADSALKAEKIVQLGYLKRLAAHEKLPAIIAWIRDYLEGTEDKLAVYGVSKDVIRNGLYQEFKRTAVCIDGDTPQEKRRGIVNQFQTDKRVRLFFGNVVAAGTGIGLVAAPQLAFAELDWVPGNHTQVEDRIHRIGQNRHTNIIYFVARGTIEERLCGIIQAKQEVITEVLDGKQVKRDLDLFDQLTKYLIGQTR